MADRYDVVITVVDQKGHCAWGHRNGDRWVCSGTTPGGVCLSAFGTLLPDIRTLQFGGTFPWAKDAEAVEVTCSDGANPVTFELRRVKKQ